MARRRRRPADVNRRLWNAQSDDYDRRFATVLSGRRAAAWGLWRIPEDDLQLLGPVDRRAVLEVGCGAARWSAALATRRARAVALDFSRSQLRHARRVAGRSRRPVSLVMGSVERLPFAPETFDVVFCDWGALTFSDPRVAIPECSRVLRHGGRLAFATMSPFRAVVTSPTRGTVGRRLRRSYFELGQLDLPREVNYTLPYGAWVGLFSEHQLVVRKLIELAPGRRPSSYLTPSEHRWARSWPMEVIWLVQKDDQRKADRPRSTSRVPAGRVRDRFRPRAIAE